MYSASHRPRHTTGLSSSMHEQRGRGLTEEDKGTIDHGYPHDQLPPTPSSTSSRTHKPKTLTCYICTKEFGTASLAIHAKQCFKKHKARWERQNPKSRQPLPVDPDTLTKDDLLELARFSGRRPDMHSTSTHSRASSASPTHLYSKRENLGGSPCRGASPSRNNATTTSMSLYSSTQIEPPDEATGGSSSSPTSMAYGGLNAPSFLSPTHHSYSPTVGGPVIIDNYEQEFVDKRPHIEPSGNMSTTCSNSFNTLRAVYASLTDPREQMDDNSTTTTKTTATASGWPNNDGVSASSSSTSVYGLIQQHQQGTRESPAPQPEPLLSSSLKLGTGVSHTKHNAFNLYPSGSIIEHGGPSYNDLPPATLPPPPPPPSNQISQELLCGTPNRKQSMDVYSPKYSPPHSTGGHSPAGSMMADTANSPPLMRQHSLYEDRPHGLNTGGVTTHLGGMGITGATEVSTASLNSHTFQRLYNFDTSLSRPTHPIATGLYSSSTHSSDEQVTEIFIKAKMGNPTDFNMPEEGSRTATPVIKAELDADFRASPRAGFESLNKQPIGTASNTFKFVNNPKYSQSANPPPSFSSSSFVPPQVNTNITQKTEPGTAEDGSESSAGSGSTPLPSTPPTKAHTPSSSHHGGQATLTAPPTTVGIGAVPQQGAASAAAIVGRRVKPGATNSVGVASALQGYSSPGSCKMAQRKTINNTSPPKTSAHTLNSNVHTNVPLSRPPTTPTTPATAPTVTAASTHTATATWRDRNRSNNTDSSTMTNILSSQQTPVSGGSSSRSKSSTTRVSSSSSSPVQRRLNPNPKAKHNNFFEAVASSSPISNKSRTEPQTPSTNNTGSPVMSELTPQTLPSRSTWARSWSPADDARVYSAAATNKTSLSSRGSRGSNASTPNYGHNDSPSPSAMQQGEQGHILSNNKRDSHCWKWLTNEISQPDETDKGHTEYNSFNNSNNNMECMQSLMTAHSNNHRDKNVAQQASMVDSSIHLTPHLTTNTPSSSPPLSEQRAIDSPSAVVAINMDAAVQRQGDPNLTVEIIGDLHNNSTDGEDDDDPYPTDTKQECVVVTSTVNNTQCSTIISDQSSLYPTTGPPRNSQPAAPPAMTSRHEEITRRSSLTNSNTSKVGSQPRSCTATPTSDVLSHSRSATPTQPPTTGGSSSGLNCPSVQAYPTSRFTSSPHVVMPLMTTGAPTYSSKGASNNSNKMEVAGKTGFVSTCTSSIVSGTPPKRLPNNTQHPAPPPAALPDPVGCEDPTSNKEALDNSVTVTLSPVHSIAVTDNTDPDEEEEEEQRAAVVVPIKLDYGQANRSGSLSLSTSPTATSVLLQSSVGRMSPPLPSSSSTTTTASIMRSASNNSLLSSTGKRGSVTSLRKSSATIIAPSRSTIRATSPLLQQQGLVVGSSSTSVGSIRSTLTPTTGTTSSGSSSTSSRTCSTPTSSTTSESPVSHLSSHESSHGHSPVPPHVLLPHSQSTPSNVTTTTSGLPPRSMSLTRTGGLEHVGGYTAKLQHLGLGQYRPITTQSQQQQGGGGTGNAINSFLTGGGQQRTQQSTAVNATSIGSSRVRQQQISKGGSGAPKMPKFCDECGFKFLRDGSKFCSECGVKRTVS